MESLFRGREDGQEEMKLRCSIPVIIVTRFPSPATHLSPIEGTVESLLSFNGEEEEGEIVNRR